MKKLLLFSLLLSATFSVAQTGVTTSGTITIGGVARVYSFYVPAMYDGSTAVPLIFNFHGLGGTSAQQESFGDFRKIADTANFIIVHPQGLKITALLGQNAFNVFSSQSDAIPELNFVSDLLDKLASELNINMNRVYSTGMSNGGFMSHELACKLSGRFAAIASVAGSMVPDHFTSCNPNHPTPVMQIHGTADGIVKYDGTPGSTFLTFTHIDTVVKYWASYNGCNLTPASIDTLPQKSLTADTSMAIHYVFEGGQDGSTVEFYKIIDGIHSWPGTSTSTAIGVNQDFNASLEIWRFFNQHKNFVGIEENALNSLDFSVYPNPTDGIFTISLNTISPSNFSISVVNILGKEVFNLSNSNNANTFSTQIDLTDLAAGVYFIRLSSDSSEKTHKIIIQ